MVTASILFLLFVVSGAVVLRIVIPKLSLLSSLEVDELQQQKEYDVKHAIIKGRIKRQFDDWKQFSALILEPLGKSVSAMGRILHALHQYLLEIREKQRRKKIIGGATFSKSAPSLEDKINQLLQEGRGYLFEERFLDAEQKFIEVISLDKKNSDSYKGLVEVYTGQKEWEHAKEILEYISKNEKQPQIFFQLFEVYQKCGQNDDALEALKKALVFEGTNPKFLDALVDLYITLQQRIKAEKTLEKLREINPENQKISEFEDRIKELAY